MKHLALVLILIAGPALAQEPPHAPTFDEVLQIDQLTHELQGAKGKLAEKDAEIAKASAEIARRLTADEGKKLYELGIKTGMAQAVVQAAQGDMKPILDKLQPAKP